MQAHRHRPRSSKAPAFPSNATATACFGPVKIGNWQVCGQEQVLISPHHATKHTNGVASARHRDHPGPIAPKPMPPAPLRKPRSANPLANSLSCPCTGRSTGKAREGAWSHHDPQPVGRNDHKAACRAAASSPIRRPSFGASNRRVMPPAISARRSCIGGSGGSASPTATKVA